MLIIQPPVPPTPLSAASGVLPPSVCGTQDGHVAASGLAPPMTTAAADVNGFSESQGGRSSMRFLLLPTAM